MESFKKNRVVIPVLIFLAGVVAIICVWLLWEQPIATKVQNELEPSLSLQQEPPKNQSNESYSDNKKNTTDVKFCTRQSFEEKTYIVCRVDPKKFHIKLYLNDKNGQPYRYFRNVEKMLTENGQTLAFAVNGGMYHKDFSAVGLYIENGNEQHPLSTKDGPGNFHMKPNGIFFIQDNEAGVLDTENYKKSNIKPDFATQSGPMLVIENQIHPRFIPQSHFLEYRNGVGVNEEGIVFFVNSEMKVNFDELARFFRDQLKTPNALFLDGSISSLYVPELSRYDWWFNLGPIIGVPIEVNGKKSMSDAKK